MEENSVKFVCSFDDCKREFAHKSSLSRHLLMNPEHKVLSQKVEKKSVITSSEACNQFLDSKLSNYIRKARLRELFKLVQEDEILEIVLPSVSSKVSTYDFLKSRCSARRTKTTLGKLMLEELGLTTLKVKKEFEFDTTPKPSTFTSTAVTQNIPNQIILAPLPVTSHSNSILSTTGKKRTNINRPLNFIDFMNVTANGENFQSTMTVDDICKHILNSNILKDTFMPKFVEKFHDALTDFSVGILSNFDIGQKKYQNILGNFLGRNLESITGLNPIVSKSKATDKMKNIKQELQEEVGLDFIVKGKLVAAYTDVGKHIQFLLKQPGIANCLPLPKDVMLVYDYIDEFRNLSLSYFSGSQTSIQLKIVEPHNLLSLILRLGKYTELLKVVYIHLKKLREIKENLTRF